MWFHKNKSRTLKTEMVATGGQYWWKKVYIIDICFFTKMAVIQHGFKSRHWNILKLKSANDISQTSLIFIQCYQCLQQQLELLGMAVTIFFTFINNFDNNPLIQPNLAEFSSSSKDYHTCINSHFFTIFLLLSHNNLTFSHPPASHYTLKSTSVKKHIIHA